MIKLIASDMDGTFLDENGKLPEGAFEMIETLAQQGITFAVATGRQTQTILNDFEPVADQIAIIAENGSVVRYHGETVQVVTLDRSQVHQVIRELRGIEGAITVLCTEHKAYIEAAPELIEDEIKKYYHSRAYVENLLEVAAQPIKIAVYHAQDITEIATCMREKWEGQFKLAVSGQHWVDFGHPRVHKGAAIKALQRNLGIKKEACMAFGDYFNDVELLDEVGESYAMEKAPEGVKKHAKYTLQSGQVIAKIYEVIA
ncbi:MAG: HAD family hydrolase [Cellulosilyticaceae bacterium]